MDWDGVDVHGCCVRLGSYLVGVVGEPCGRLEAQGPEDSVPAVGGVPAPEPGLGVHRAVEEEVGGLPDPFPWRLGWVAGSWVLWCEWLLLVWLMVLGIWWECGVAVWCFLVFESMRVQVVACSGL